MYAVHSGGLKSSGGPLAKWRGGEGKEKDTGTESTSVKESTSERVEAKESEEEREMLAHSGADKRSSMRGGFHRRVGSGIKYMARPLLHEGDGRQGQKGTEKKQTKRKGKERTGRRKNPHALCSLSPYLESPSCFPFPISF